MESQPQNPKFRNNPESFHPYSCQTVVGLNHVYGTVLCPST